MSGEYGASYPLIFLKLYSPNFKPYVQVRRAFCCCHRKRSKLVSVQKVALHSRFRWLAVCKRFVLRATKSIWRIINTYNSLDSRKTECLRTNIPAHFRATWWKLLFLTAIVLLTRFSTTQLRRTNPSMYSSVLSVVKWHLMLNDEGLFIIF